MSPLSARTVRIAKWSAIPVALLASGAIVATSSYAAFSATTSNPTSNWKAGTVALSDDDSNTALFTATELKPGSSGTKCITVTSTSSLPSAVKLYGSGAASTKGLSDAITLKVVQGTGGSFGDCTGFTPAVTGSSVFTGTLASFGSTATSFATGQGSWVTTAGSASESRTYQLTYTLPENTANTLQGGTAAMGFTWEAQNN